MYGPSIFIHVVHPVSSVVTRSRVDITLVFHGSDPRVPVSYISAVFSLADLSQPTDNETWW